MLLRSVYLHRLPGSAHEAMRTSDLAPELARQGFAVHDCRSTGVLRGALIEQIANPGMALAVLRGDPTLICAELRGLLTLRPNVRFVAIPNHHTDQHHIELLDAGADACFNPSAPIAVLAAMLSRLADKGSQMPQQGSCRGDPSSWLLVDQGWSLVSPQDLRVPLTTGERAFLMTLFAATSKQATHDELSLAVQLSYGSGSLSDRSRSLGVLVARLRRKCRQAGLVLPLKSVHRSGYMFAA